MVDPLYKSINEAVDDIYSHFINEFEYNQIAFFGHSMGAILVYELLWKLQLYGLPEPIHVFFSGRYPPYLKKARTAVYLLGDRDFISFLSSMFRSTDGLLQHRDFLNIIMPVIRNDIKLVETYRHNHDILHLHCSVTSMTGIKDPLVTSDDCKKWAQCTSGPFFIREFDDGHFFINSHKEEVISYINEVLVPQ